MRINQVFLDDLDQIAKMEKKTFKEDAFSKETIKKLIEQKIFFLKLVSNKPKNKIIGFIIAIKDDEERVNIVNFLIQKKYRKNGYGTFLLDKTIEKIKELKEIKRIVLNVKITNKEAIALYKKFQFQIVQKINNYYHQKESAYLMVLRI